MPVSPTKSQKSGSVPDVQLNLTQQLSGTHNDKSKEISVGCDICNSWTTVSIPVKRMKNLKKEPYICGFCTIKEIELVKKGIVEINTDLDTVKEKQEHFTIVCQNINELNYMTKMCEERSKSIEEKLDKIFEKQLRAQTPTRPSSRNTPELRYKLQEFKYIQEKLSKENNIIVKGLKITADTKQQVLNILTAMEIESYKDQILSIIKIGNYISKHNTATYKVTFSTNKAPRDMLRNRYKLKDFENCKYIYIENDKTKEELFIYHKLRKELIERRKNGEQCIIRNNKIVIKTNVAETADNVIRIGINNEDNNIPNELNIDNNNIRNNRDNTPNDDNVGRITISNENTSNTYYNKCNTNPFLG